MDALRKEYEGLRTEYRAVLEQAIRAKDNATQKAAVEGLLSLNRRMSNVASAMMDRVAKMENSVNLDELRGYLSDELVRIQTETKSLHAKRQERVVLEGIYKQYQAQETTQSRTVFL
jgi:hypothetical protein